jgi:hypothetical protein
MKTIKHYVNSDGKSLGDFEGSIPDNGIEVPMRPQSGLDIWDGEKWNPAPLASEQIRDNALAAIDSYDYGDGRVIQIRTKDRDNLIGGIAKATPVWKMLDNKVYSVTVADLQAALDDQEAQIAAIWMAHFADLEQGVLL